MSVLTSKKKNKEMTEDMFTVQSINEFLDNAPVIARTTPEEYKLLADNVVRAAFRRDTFLKLKECESICFDDDEECLGEKVYSALDTIMMNYTASTDIVPFSELIDDIWENIKMRQRGESPAIEFPFPLLNEYVVMEPGEAICFTAPQKVGKSAMLLTITVDLLRKNKSVLVIDTEITTQLYTMRLLSHITGIRFSKIRAGDYTEEEETVIQQAIEWLKTRKFCHEYMPIIDENAVYLAAKKAKHTMNIDVLVLDYLKANPGSEDNTAYGIYNSLGRISDMFKNRICGDMKICGLTAAQAKTDGEIADSAKIARSMSTIVSVVEKSYQEFENDGTNAPRKMRVRFNRNGAQMDENNWIDMGFNGATLTYFQAPIQHVIEQPY